jgi:hypothetical protein
MDSGYFELHFRPTIGLVTVVRRFVTSFYERLLRDPEGTSRVALTTHELLENSVKYAKDGETQLRIDVERATGRVRIRLRNRADPVHVAAIREILDGIRDTGDPMQFYQDLLVRKVRDDESSTGGLGLARICAEADMEISFEVDGDVVVLESTTTVRPSRSRND